MIQIARRTCWLSVGCLAFAALPGSASGQGNTFNPYGNSGYADYREFATPIYSNDPSLPGQARLQSQPLGERPNRSNQFEQYFDRAEELGAVGGAGAAKRGVAAPGMPYYRSYRQYDTQFNRVYTPNAKADLEFNARLRQRDARYATALRETDPVKRAKLIRQLNNDDPASLTRPPVSAKSASKSATAKSKAGTAPPPPGSPRASSSAPSAGAVPYPRGLDPAFLGTGPRPRTAPPRPAVPASTSPAPAATPTAPSPASSPIPAPG